MFIEPGIIKKHTTPSGVAPLCFMHFSIHIQSRWDWLPIFTPETMQGKIILQIHSKNDKYELEGP